MEVSMRKWMRIVVLLAGCGELADQQSEGVALATVRGTLSLGQDVPPPATTLRVSVLWRNPAFGGSSPREPGILIIPPGQETLAPRFQCAEGQSGGWRFETGLLEQPGRLITAFPSGFSVQLSEPPPASALFDYPDGSGASVARGDLVIYEDRNGNGKLDPKTLDARSPDLIFGSSLGIAPWGIGQRKHYTIVYLTRDTSVPEGTGKAGYSLVTGEYNAIGLEETSAQQLSDATIELTLDPTTYAQQLACNVLCKTVDSEYFRDVFDVNTFLARDLGVRLPSTGAVGTTTWLRQDGDASVLTAVSCTRDSDGTNSLRLSVVGTRGCAESTSTLIIGGTPAQGPDAYPLPCAEFKDVSGFLPKEP
jgi:hypothetical protein